MAVQVALLTAILTLSLSAPASVAEPAIRLPSDVPVPDGTAVDTLCGSCCHDGAYCGRVPEDVVMVDASNHTASILVPQGSSMTCMLRARNVFGAIDGGLCVPSILPQGFSLANMCRALDKVSAVFRLCVVSRAEAHKWLALGQQKGLHHLSPSHT